MTVDVEIASLKSDYRHLSESMGRIEGQLAVLVQLVGKVTTLERDFNGLGTKIETINAKIELLSKKTDIDPIINRENSLDERISKLEKWQYGMIAIYVFVSWVISNPNKIISLLMQH